MRSLTVAYITARPDSRVNWFTESLAKQVRHQDALQIIIVDAGTFGTEKVDLSAFKGFPSVSAIWTGPKPTIWQGPHRLTKEDWWAKSNALNTAICLCKTEWISFVDDRSVLMPGWLDRIEVAMNENYAVVGTYEKRAGMKVENGHIIEYGELLGRDHRPPLDGPFETKDWYGGHGALPLEWCLRVNGFSEDVCDSLGSEDSMFGVTLHNSGYPIRYDPRMMIIEDRTPGEIDGALKRADKGVSPRDKSHAIVEIFRDKTSSQNSFDIRNLRDRVLNGEPFPPPSASHLDWYDQQPVSEMI